MRRYLIAFAAVALLLWAVPALAQGFDLKNGIVGNLPYECRVNGDCSFCDFMDLFIVLQKVILSLFGGLAIIMLIWAGQGIITAAGNSQKVAEARKLIFSTLLGVVIILAGYFLITILVMVLAAPTAQQTPTSGILTWDKWKQAFCSQSNESGFCKERGDGTPCTVNSKAGTCQNNTCIENPPSTP
ncbi:MAG: hypothetical protein Q8P77_01700 [Candidatus Veblenbacteria bacterium]|nr:hypothetical protein [Candidatus Veblenbacteria bacterium]